MRGDLAPHPLAQAPHDEAAVRPVSERANQPLDLLRRSTGLAGSWRAFRYHPPEICRRRMKMESETLNATDAYSAARPTHPRVSLDHLKAQTSSDEHTT